MRGHHLGACRRAAVSLPVRGRDNEDERLGDNRLATPTANVELRRARCRGQLRRQHAACRQRAVPQGGVPPSRGPLVRRKTRANAPAKCSERQAPAGLRQRRASPDSSSGRSAPRRPRARQLFGDHWRSFLRGQRPPLRVQLAAERSPARQRAYVVWLSPFQRARTDRAGGGRRPPVVGPLLRAWLPGDSRSLAVADVAQRTSRPPRLAPATQHATSPSHWCDVCDATFDGEGWAGREPLG